MKTNFAYIAMQITEDNANVMHMVFYEDKPGDAELIAIMDELATNEEFGLTHLTIGVDYNIYYFEGEKLQKVKELLKIPDELTEVV